MKILLLNGSPHETGNTFYGLKTVAAEMEVEDIEIKIVQLAKANYAPCKACYVCAKKKDKKCHGVKDDLNELIAEMIEADGLILGTPVWFSAATSYLKNVLDRAGMVSRTGEPLFQRKIGAAVVAVRRSGASPTFSELNYWFLINEMIVVGSSYWNMGLGASPGDVLKDEEGMQTFKTLGKNLAWTLKRLA